MRQSPIVHVTDEGLWIDGRQVAAILSTRKGQSFTYSLRPFDSEFGPYHGATLDEAKEFAEKWALDTYVPRVAARTELQLKIRLANEREWERQNDRRRKDLRRALTALGDRRLPDAERIPLLRVWRSEFWDEPAPKGLRRKL